MGTVMGAYLSRAGIAVDLISRDREHITALAAAGAKIGGTVSFSTPPFNGALSGRALLPAEMREKYDVIFLLTKQRDTAAASEKLKSALGSGGVVCTLQNGIPEPGLAEILGRDKVLGCLAVWGAVKTGPGAADLTSDPRSMSFGLAGPDSEDRPMTRNIRSILEKICPVTVEPNFTGLRWSKLLINAAFSGMSAVTGRSFGQVAADRRSRRCALRLIRECIEVCHAAGIRLEPVQGRDIVRLMYYTTPLQQLRASLILPFAIRKHRAIRSGMLRDLERGRPCDIDAINGVVSRFGARYQVPTPYHDRIVEIVHAIERGNHTWGPHNLALFT
jgi:2-dehydropantoate 2-reductase